MTPEEIRTRYEQSQQNEINLNYSKWCEMRRQQKLSMDHAIWEKQRDQTLQRMQRENAELRAKRLAGLEAERQQAAAEDEAKLLGVIRTNKRGTVN